MKNNSLLPKGISIRYYTFQKIQLFFQENHSYYASFTSDSAYYDKRFFMAIQQKAAASHSTPKFVNECGVLCVGTITRLKKKFAKFIRIGYYFRNFSPLCPRD